MLLLFVPLAKQRQTVAETPLLRLRPIVLRLMQRDATSVCGQTGIHVRAEAETLAAMIAALLGEGALLDALLMRTGASARST
ncbi:MAG: hypothetical protein ACREQF_11655 [Candidatus Binataceae bacterium]